MGGLNERPRKGKPRPPWIQTQIDEGYRPYSFYVDYTRTSPLGAAHGTSTTTPHEIEPPDGATTHGVESGGQSIEHSESSRPGMMVEGGEDVRHTQVGVEDITEDIIQDTRDMDTGVQYRAGAIIDISHNMANNTVTRQNNANITMDNSVATIIPRSIGNSETTVRVTQSTATPSTTIMVVQPPGNTPTPPINTSTKTEPPPTGKSRVENPDSSTQSTGRTTVKSVRTLPLLPPTITWTTLPYHTVDTQPADSDKNVTFENMSKDMSEDMSEDRGLSTEDIAKTEITYSVTTASNEESETTISQTISEYVHITTDSEENTTKDTTTTSTTLAYTSHIPLDYDTTSTDHVTTETPPPTTTPDIPCKKAKNNRDKTPPRNSRKRKNKKRIRGRRPGMTTPDSLSMGYGVQNTHFPYPLPDSSHPQVYFSQPPYTPPIEHTFARNTTYSVAGLTTGQVTGIAIACIVAFWIILGPLVCIICKMRDKAKESRRERETDDGMSHTLIEEMIKMELARGRAKMYQTNVDDEREIERLPLQPDCCNTCNSNGSSCTINPQNYVIGNRYHIEYTPVDLTTVPNDYDKDYKEFHNDYKKESNNEYNIINQTYVDSLDTKLYNRDTNL